MVIKQNQDQSTKFTKIKANKKVLDLSFFILSGFLLLYLIKLGGFLSIIFRKFFGFSPQFFIKLRGFFIN